MPATATATSPAAAAGTTCWTRLASPLGPITLVGSEAGLTGVQLPTQRHAPHPGPDWVEDPQPFAEAIAQLEAFFAGERQSFSLDLAAAGTPFQQAVWRELTAIPFGTTISYRTLAERVGNPKAVRAVGLAVGRNPLAVIVPCHRVIGASGALTGYAAGLDRKRWLLAHEARVAGTVLPLPLTVGDGVAPHRSTATPGHQKR